jgi:ABC-type multidrug transport system fused ATPase/permease subunit
MADLDGVATRVSDSVRYLLSRIGGFALGVARFAAIIGVLTFLTGWWVFDGSRPTWAVIGGAICAAPCLAALVAWFQVRRTMRAAPAMLGDVRALMSQSQDAATTLIDYDTGERLVVASRSFEPLRAAVSERRTQLPALWSGVRAITTLPGLATIAIIGTVLVGGLGTILLIGGLID